MPDKYDHIDFKPSEACATAAKRGLELRSEHGRGGTEVGVARARDLKNRKNLSPATLRRMKSYFDRSEHQKSTKGWGVDSAGYIAWMLWGGDPGYSWAKKVCRQMDTADAKSSASVLESRVLKRLVLPLRNIAHMNIQASGRLPITKVILQNELDHVFKSLTEKIEGVLIGGLAVCFYAKPRLTTDADFLYLSETDIPLSVEGFKKSRPHCFVHKGTGIEFEVLTSSYLKMASARAQHIMDTCVVSEGFKIASPEGLIVSKLGRWNRQDQADCEAVMLAVPGDLTVWILSKTEKQEIQKIINDNPTVKWKL